MSVVIDIKNSLCKLISSNFEDFEVYTEEIPTIKNNEKFQDYFFIEYVPLNVKTLNAVQTEYSVLINIICQTYEHSNENYFKLGAEVDGLIRPYVSFNGRNITVENVEYKVLDKTLRYKFKLNFLDSKELDESYPTMEDLERRVY